MKRVTLCFLKVSAQALLVAILAIGVLAIGTAAYQGAGGKSGFGGLFGLGGGAQAQGGSFTGWYPGFITDSAQSTTVSGVANQIQTEGFIMPAGTDTIAKLVFYVQTQDTVNNSDFGIYNSSGTQQCHVGGATYATGQKTPACSATLTGGKYYIAMCSAATTLQINGSVNHNHPFELQASATSCTSGALPASITIPADTAGFNTAGISMQ